MINCKKGHAYDPEKHTSCPFCGVDIEDFDIYFPSSSVNYGHVNTGTESFGRTMPIEHKVERPQEDEKVELVVGWLVCISEKNKGRDYRVLSGRNKIGRDSSNDICIPSDFEVLSNEHANIIFDPRSQVFYLTLGSGRGLAYLNDVLLLKEELLTPYDRIRVGNTDLVFVPFCSDKFRWS